MSHNHRINYSLDVLVDGSEQSGPPTLFLSVHKDHVIQANYALTGLGDLLCRAAADQRYKLQHVRAVFADHDLLSLPALLDVLYQAGREQVTVVSSFPRIESLIRTIHPYKQHPVVRICQVPSETDCWWNVYQDEFILVHATRRSNHVLYLYTLFQWKETIKSSFLVLPSAYLPHLHDLLQDLPLEDSTPLEICALIVICETNDVEVATWVPDHIPYYIVAPTSNNLLVRAQRLSQYFHNIHPNLFPLRLPEGNILSQQLTTGTSLIFSPRNNHTMVHRMEDIGRETIRPERQRWMEGLLSFEPIADENEIYLNDDDDDDDETEDTNTTLRLLVLGTGCAAPSPYRGASGYALLFPNDCTVVLEAGEGFVTQWHRYADGISFNTIRLIWISHAHLDHYGGLVHLLKCIHASKRNQDSPEHKRRKLSCPYVVAGKKILQYLEHMFDVPNDYYNGVEQSDIQQTGNIYESIAPIAFWEDVRVDHSCHQACAETQLPVSG
ncbi:hypothetical protein FisN_10Hh269 [Fistulifera solaris]|uniref:ribonuclease Z n=1 Tax=Fistulifera solaris TaxID=1519565 RepID=A0A1Z5JXQ4_FISSO|nr:hypothetical protein FisN_10Hh269 [Fistulifera solaris]|eukprot:GAX18531.1 hypothetical protein FisN_10Hh269 [Fistulifera solaris]